jgi:hypothetical protein
LPRQLTVTRRILFFSAVFRVVGWAGGGAALYFLSAPDSEGRYTISPVLESIITVTTPAALLGLALLAVGLVWLVVE